MGITIEPPGPPLTIAQQVSISAYGKVTGPAASGVIAQITGVPGGTYQVTVIPELAGTITAAEQDNMQLLSNASVKYTIPVQALPTTGAPQQQTSSIVFNGGGTFTVEAVGAGGAAAVYSALIIATRI